MISRRLARKTLGTAHRGLSWKPLVVLGLVSAVIAASPNAAAWGGDGHRLIADAALKQLSTSAKTEVDRLLALEPGATLASISTWADETRTPSTAAWHYVNLPRDSNCKFEQGRSCIQGGCVVAAIDAQIAVLASGVGDEQRLKALKYVVHFVGDVHQPLHAGFADDRGGNSYQLQAFGRGTNMHSLWDSALIQQWPGGIPALRAAVEAEKTSVDLTAAPGLWAEASCRVVTANGFYPEGHKLPDEYAQRWSPTLVQQLAAAGRRLAAVLNQTLSGR